MALNLKKGNTYFQNMALEVQVKQEVNGQKIDISMASNAIMSFKVTEVHTDHYDILVSYDYMTMGISTPYGIMEFSSDSKDTTDIMSRVLSQMVNYNFEIELNKNGTVRKISGINKWFSNMVSIFPEIPENQLKSIQEQIKKSFGDDAFKGNLETGLAIYPNEDVAVNDTWENRIQLNAMLPGYIDNRFTLVEYTDTCAVIKASSTIETTGNESSIDFNGMSATYDLDGAMDANIKVDPETGWIIESVINQNIKGNVKISASPQVPNGMSMPMQFINKIKINNSL